MTRPKKRAVRFGVFFVIALLTVSIVPAMFSASKAMGQTGPAAPELVPNLGWLNSDRPLRFSDELKGHVVLLDFWTYCCINCMHVLPDLEYLEDKYADEPFVVIGVHSAKFDEEGDRQSVRHAMQRYDIHHPVVIDDGRQIWQSFGVRSWPSFVLIGADGNVIGTASGEGNRELLDQAIQGALDEAKLNDTLAPERVELKLDGEIRSASGLRYPGKVDAMPPSAEGDRGWLAIADSSNDRVILATYPDDQGRSELVRIVGSGDAGLVDGPSGTAGFHDPQGMAFDATSGLLYVADTKNHAIRTIDLESFEVSTIVGNGTQGYDRRGGRAGSEQPLASPWDVEMSGDSATLYIAMAGTHQLWELDLETQVARLLAGSSYENIIDGPATEAQLAQPSGLALSSDAKELFFADSETSAIRTLELGQTRDEGVVRTLIGTGLFDFGDVDGVYPDARLQHPLGVEVWSQEGGDRLFVCDTYNSKIKILNPDERVVGQWLGSGSVGGDSAMDLELAEPAGIDLATDSAGAAHLFIADTNHHRVVMVDVPERAWREVLIDGLSSSEAEAESDSQTTAESISVNAAAGFELEFDVALASGAKPNTEYPMQVRIVRRRNGERATIAQHTLATPRLPVLVEIGSGLIAPSDQLLIYLSFGFCFEDGGVCMPADLGWKVDVAGGDARSAVLSTRKTP